VEHEDNGAASDPQGERQGNGPAAWRDIEVQHPARWTMPPTVLVTGLDNDTLILQGRPDGPRRYLSPEDAVPLRRELARAIGSPDLSPGDAS
jgi:hypothetical protein